MVRAWIFTNITKTWVLSFYSKSDSNISMQHDNIPMKRGDWGYTNIARNGDTIYAVFVGVVWNTSRSYFYFVNWYIKKHCTIMCTMTQ